MFKACFSYFSETSIGQDLSFATSMDVVSETLCTFAIPTNISIPPIKLLWSGWEYFIHVAS